jgi:hypothetical protein
VSADEPLVGATWKLRAIVYGLLAAIAVLVLVARPSSHAEAVATPLVTLHGTTAQGSPIWVGVQNGHVRNLYVTRIKPKCGRPVLWQQVVGLSRGSYSEERPWIYLSRDWDDAWAIMTARVYRSGHAASGWIAFGWDRCRREPAAIRFSASG